jgi:hypothetical protein
VLVRQWRLRGLQRAGGRLERLEADGQQWLSTSHGDGPICRRSVTIRDHPCSWLLIDWWQWLVKME